MASFLAVNGGKPVRESNLPYGKQTIDENDIKEVVKCITDPYLTTGPRVGKFEQDVCDYTGAKYGVAVCNGTAALHVAVNAAGAAPLVQQAVRFQAPSDHKKGSCLL